MKVFITGLTGTLGTAIAQLHKERGDAVWGCARSESRAVAWLAANPELALLHLADAGSLATPRSPCGRLLPMMDRVYHCAAMKHVDLCEAHPAEALQQNVSLSSTLAIACNQAGVALTFISSDKACLPGGVYGLTKLLAERMVVREGGAAVRLGNLIGSSGSVFSLWNAAVAEGKPVKVTDRTMTRYFIGVSDAAEFLVNEVISGKVVIPWPMKVGQMGTLADAIAGDKIPVVEVGRRPGETKHQWLVSPDEGYNLVACTSKIGSNKILLTDSHQSNGDGIHSSNGVRWKPVDLLRIAGVAI